MDLKGSSCPICFESLKDKIVGSPDVCDHKFCLLCLEKWTKHENFCPVDRRRFKKIISGDKVIRIKHKRKKKGTELYDISVYCEICKETKENNDTVILCDCCDLAFHFICLKPPLKSIPHGNWYCPDCLEISRKLESQKKEKKKHSNNPSVYSKQSSTLLPPDFAAPATKSSNPLTNGNRVKNSIGENTNMKLTNDGHNYSKESHFSEKDDCQKNFSDTKTVNVPFNCTDTPSGEFEDFFNISNNVVILMNRKFLRSEGKSLNKSLGKECRTNYSMNLRRLQHAKDAECNNFKMQQIEKRTKRLAATTARKKMIENLKKDNINCSVEDSSYSSGQCSAADMEKVLSNQNSRNEFLSSKSESENAILDSDSRCSKSTKKINIVMKDSNKSSESKSSNICENLVKSSTAKVSDCVTESSDSINSHSVFKKPGCESFSACTKINDSMTEELNNAEIPMALESLSVSEKHENTPELTLEPLHIFKNSESEMPSESPPPSLIPNKNLENEVFSIKDAETEHDHSVVEESNNAKNGSSSETFSVFEKITDTSSSTEKFSNMNRYNNEETCSHMEDYQSAENPKNDEPLQEKDNYDEIEADENILNNFHMRQVHYAIKAKINLPAELQKIEEEAWLSHRSKSSRKYKNKSFHKKAKVCISHDQVVSRKKEHCVFSNDTPHSDNKSTYSKQDVKFNNKFNPFCQSVCGSPPKKLFKVTEYAFQQVRSKNVLQNIMDPYSLKHLDIREDGSLFLNWNKSNCVASF
ncbi:dentin sialophosphoprotein-like isoform X2 [Argiope bruennichi]|uniref:dentin sialophosphoprotein-like isoform X2 n=1 Tax=Argiope bruennichi TaxID=94029 RepID=UPI002493E861|nr:dentin sialophosphoprotein-like isoform X2 [Argiope bruennichi]